MTEPRVPHTRTAAPSFLLVGHCGVCSLNSRRYDYDALEAEAVALIKEDGLTENAAAQRVGNRHGGEDDVETIARTLRRRLRKRRSATAKPAGPPLAGTLVLLPFLEERESQYRADLNNFPPEDRLRELAARVIILKELVRRRLDYLESLDYAEHSRHARDIIGNLDDIDLDVVPEQLPREERRRLEALRHRLVELLELIERRYPNDEEPFGGGYRHL